MAFFNNIKNIKDKIAQEDNIQDLNKKIDEYDNLKKIKEKTTFVINDKAQEETNKKQSEKEFFNTLTKDEKIEYNRRKKKRKNMKRLGLYGLGAATAAMGVGIPILMAAGTFDILNDDSMTTPENQTTSNNTNTANTIATDNNDTTNGTTYDYDEDDLSDTFSFEDGYGNNDQIYGTDYDYDGLDDSWGISSTDSNGNTTEMNFEDTDGDYIPDNMKLSGINPLTGNYDDVALYDSDNDGLTDSINDISYDNNGNVVDNYSMDLDDW